MGRALVIVLVVTLFGGCNARKKQAPRKRDHAPLPSTTEKTAPPASRPTPSKQRPRGKLLHRVRPPSDPFIRNRRKRSQGKTFSSRPKLPKRVVPTHGRIQSVKELEKRARADRSDTHSSARKSPEECDEKRECQPDNPAYKVKN